MSELGPDNHPRRTLNIPDAPLDAANQSLADALRASFNVLKAIMVVLVVMFMFSGLKCVQEHQRAVVMRFGKLQPTERAPGLSWAWPFPIDETLRVGVTAETLKFKHSHWFRVRPDEEQTPLIRLMRTGGLHPKRDGSLLTGDRALAHVRWSLVYRIEDLAAFVANVGDTNGEQVRKLLQTLLENSAVRVASEMTAAGLTQTHTDRVAQEVKRLINEELDQLRTGIRVITVEIPRATVPLQTLQAFAAVTNAESKKTASIAEARQKATELLNAAAGAAHGKLLGAVDELEDAQARGNLDEAARIEQRIDDILENQAGGLAGAAIRGAEANYTRVVQGMRGDVEQFESLLAEYERAPQLLLDRLWQETERRILGSEGVTKWYLPVGQKEVRIRLGPDPRDQRAAEKRRYSRQEGEVRISQPGLELDLGLPEEPAGGKRK